MGRLGIIAVWVGMLFFGGNVSATAGDRSDSAPGVWQALEGRLSLAPQELSAGLSRLRLTEAGYRQLVLNETAPSESDDDELDDLILEPLAPTPVETDEDDEPDELELEPLELEPLELEPLELEALPGLVPLGPAVEPEEPELDLTEIPRPAPVWYQDWRVLSGAGVAVLTGTVSLLYLLSDDDEGEGSGRADLDHRLCGDGRGCVSWDSTLSALLGL